MYSFLHFSVPFTVLHHDLCHLYQILQVICHLQYQQQQTTVLKTFHQFSLGTCPFLLQCQMIVLYICIYQTGVVISQAGINKCQIMSPFKFRECVISCGYAISCTGLMNAGFSLSGFRNSLTLYLIVHSCFTFLMPHLHLVVQLFVVSVVIPTHL